jgi:hypothetical protein
VSQVLKAGGVRSAVVADWNEFRGLLVEKLLWSSIFWLLSAALGAKPVSVLIKDSVEEAWRQLVDCSLSSFAQTAVMDFSSQADRWIV